LLDAEEQTSDESTRQSTWRGIKKKVILLLPFIWPHGSLQLQLCVLACVGLLVAGRVTNLYVPLYYKKIGNNFYFLYFVGVLF
jgi:ATP-binding cassette subfamily B (MDR/TAP) protein 6